VLDQAGCIRNVALQHIMTNVTLDSQIVAFGSGASPSLTPSASIIGAKAAMLCAASLLGLPVPAGFVMVQDTCRLLADKNAKTEPEDVTSALEHLEAATGLKIDGTKPLLLAIRISTAVSIPGTGDAILNVGLNDETVESLARETADARYAYDSYCRFIQNYAQVVMGDDPTAFEDISALYMEERGYVSDTELQGSDMRELSTRFKAQYESNNGVGFPQHTLQQIRSSCAALLRSWAAPRARTHRKLQGLDESQGMAVIIQAMVNGVLGEASGVGRVITRHPQSGQSQMEGEFLPNAIGHQLSARLRPNVTMQSLESAIPAGFAELGLAVQGLEYQLRDGLDVDFVFENGKLWLLSAKPCRRNAQAALRMALDYAEKALLSREDVVLRIDPLSLDQLLHSTIDPDEKRNIIATGLPASPGAVSGLIIFDAEEARTLAAQGRRVILVRPETMPEDIRGLHAAEGVLTTRGGMTSHAAVIARGMGKPCVSGASSMKIDTKAGTLTAPGMVLNRYDIITLDGATGQILKGAIPTLKPELSGDFATLLEWADQCRRMKVRANAETVQDARMARDFGAEGIGLCRTEHMFFEGDRLVAMREMILADKEKDRRAALAKVLPMLRGDFVALFEIMVGLPVTIRLLDPPLHEFLPDGGREIEAVAKSLNADPEVLVKRINELHEQNPMLGHRGVRLLLSFPEIVEMQARAIFEAVVETQKSTDTPPIPEIMVPLVASRMELDLVRARIDATAIAVEKETGTVLAYRVGTMIELPRAALKAGDIATSAEFFSFGTNDLTQTTFGISRDDSSRFINEYQAKGIFNRDPFVTLDVEGVGELIDLAVQRGRATRPDIHLGICGEHGGDPDSIAFCEAIELDYVSCSPFRVPIARLACAQASLRKKHKIQHKQ
jgi:pyruvate, orthophosphate dikinase